MKTRIASKKGIVSLMCLGISAFGHASEPSIDQRPAVKIQASIEGFPFPSSVAQKSGELPTIVTGVGKQCVIAILREFPGIATGKDVAAAPKAATAGFQIPILVNETAKGWSYSGELIASDVEAGRSALQGTTPFAGEVPFDKSLAIKVADARGAEGTLILVFTKTTAAKEMAEFRAKHDLR